VVVEKKVISGWKRYLVKYWVEIEWVGVAMGELIALEIRGVVDGKATGKWL
jgi:hypothetical protein